MRHNEAKDAPSTVDLEQLEKTLLTSIKLMKRGRREIERMRRKSQHDSEQGRAA